MKELLLEFLNTPLDSGDRIFDRFAALPGAVAGKGAAPLQRYVCIPGTREDAVVLIAHMDTVWDKAYKKPFSGEHAVIFENGIFRSGSPDCGIGADCRAGCAMLWALRDSGHTILLTDGEEFGKHGAKYLKKSDPGLFAKLNRHKYMIELDWQGTDCCLFNQVDSTKKFRHYIEHDLGFMDSKASGGTDLQILCRNICGVNLGIGYHGWHRNTETLDLSEWENTREKVSRFLEKTQPRFPIPIRKRYIRLAKRCAGKVLRKLGIRKK